MSRSSSSLSTDDGSVLQAWPSFTSGEGPGVLFLAVDDDDDATLHFLTADEARDLATVLVRASWEVEGMGVLRS